MTEDSDYLVSLYSFRDDADLPEFYAHCHEAIRLMTLRHGFRSAFGYFSPFEEAKYRYISILELESFDFLYSLGEEINLVSRLATPTYARAMRIFSSMKTRTHPHGSEHLKTTDDSVTLINPFAISYTERDSLTFERLRQLNTAAIKGQQGHLGYRGFNSTNPSALHNYIAVSEWESETRFLAWRTSTAYTMANSHANHIVNSGYPMLYKLLIGYTNAGLAIDKRSLYLA